MVFEELVYSFRVVGEQDVGDQVYVFLGIVLPHEGLELLHKGLLVLLHIFHYFEEGFSPDLEVIRVNVDLLDLSFQEEVE